MSTDISSKHVLSIKLEYDKGSFGDFEEKANGVTSQIKKVTETLNKSQESIKTATNLFSDLYSKADGANTSVEKAKSHVDKGNPDNISSVSAELAKQMKELMKPLRGMARFVSKTKDKTSVLEDGKNPLMMLFKEVTATKKMLNTIKVDADIVSNMVKDVHTTFPDSKKTEALISNFNAGLQEMDKAQKEFVSVLSGKIGELDKLLAQKVTAQAATAASPKEVKKSKKEREDIGGIFKFMQDFIKENPAPRSSKAKDTEAKIKVEVVSKPTIPNPKPGKSTGKRHMDDSGSTEQDNNLNNASDFTIPAKTARLISKKGAPVPTVTKVSDTAPSAPVSVISDSGKNIEINTAKSKEQTKIALAAHEPAHSITMNTPALKLNRNASAEREANASSTSLAARLDEFSVAIYQSVAIGCDNLVKGFKSSAAAVEKVREITQKGVNLGAGIKGTQGDEITNKLLKLAKKIGTSSSQNVGMDFINRINNAGTKNHPLAQVSGYNNIEFDQETGKLFTGKGKKKKFLSKQETFTTVSSFNRDNKKNIRYSDYDYDADDAAYSVYGGLSNIEHDRDSSRRLGFDSEGNRKPGTRITAADKNRMLKGKTPEEARQINDLVRDSRTSIKTRKELLVNNLSGLFSPAIVDVDNRENYDNLSKETISPADASKIIGKNQKGYSRKLNSLSSEKDPLKKALFYLGGKELMEKHGTEKNSEDPTGTLETLIAKNFGFKSKEHAYSSLHEGVTNAVAKRRIKAYSEITALLSAAIEKAGRDENPVYDGQTKLNSKAYSEINKQLYNLKRLLKGKTTSGKYLEADTGNVSFSDFIVFKEIEESVAQVSEENFSNIKMPKFDANKAAYDRMALNKGKAEQKVKKGKTDASGKEIMSKESIAKQIALRKAIKESANPGQVITKEDKSRAYSGMIFAGSYEHWRDKIGETKAAVKAKQESMDPAYVNSSEAVDRAYKYITTQKEEKAKTSGLVITENMKKWGSDKTAKGKNAANTVSMFSMPEGPYNFMTGNTGAFHLNMKDKAKSFIEESRNGRMINFFDKNEKLKRWASPVSEVEKSNPHTFKKMKLMSASMENIQNLENKFIKIAKDNNNDKASGFNPDDGLTSIKMREIVRNILKKTLHAGFKPLETYVSSSDEVKKMFAEEAKKLNINSGKTYQETMESGLFDSLFDGIKKYNDSSITANLVESANPTTNMPGFKKSKGRMMADVEIDEKTGRPLEALDREGLRSLERKIKNEKDKIRREAQDEVTRKRGTDGRTTPAIEKMMKEVAHIASEKMSNLDKYYEKVKNLSKRQRVQENPVVEEPKGKPITFAPTETEAQKKERLERESLDSVKNHIQKNKKSQKNAVDSNNSTLKNSVDDLIQAGSENGWDVKITKTGEQTLALSDEEKSRKETVSEIYKNIDAKEAALKVFEEQSNKKSKEEIKAIKDANQEWAKSQEKIVAKRRVIIKKAQLEVLKELKGMTFNSEEQKEAYIRNAVDNKLGRFQAETPEENKKGRISAFTKYARAQLAKKPDIKTKKDKEIFVQTLVDEMLNKIEKDTTKEENVYLFNYKGREYRFKTLDEARKKATSFLEKDKSRKKIEIDLGKIGNFDLEYPDGTIEATEEFIDMGKIGEITSTAYTPVQKDHTATTINNNKKEVNKTSKAIKQENRARRNSRTNTDGLKVLTPKNSAVKTVQEQIEALEKEIDSLNAEINSPAINDRFKDRKSRRVPTSKEAVLTKERQDKVKERNELINQVNKLKNGTTNGEEESSTEVKGIDEITIEQIESLKEEKNTLLEKREEEPFFSRRDYNRYKELYQKNSAFKNSKKTGAKVSPLTTEEKSELLILQKTVKGKLNAKELERLSSLDENIPKEVKKDEDLVRVILKEVNDKLTKNDKNIALTARQPAQKFFGRGQITRMLFGQKKRDAKTLFKGSDATELFERIRNAVYLKQKEGMNFGDIKDEIVSEIVKTEDGKHSINKPKNLKPANIKDVYSSLTEYYLEKRGDKNKSPLFTQADIDKNVGKGVYEMPHKKDKKSLYGKNTKPLIPDSQLLGISTAIEKSVSDKKSTEEIVNYIIKKYIDPALSDRGTKKAKAVEAVKEQPEEPKKETERATDTATAQAANLGQDFFNGIGGASFGGGFGGGFGGVNMFGGMKPKDISNLLMKFQEVLFIKLEKAVEKGVIAAFKNGKLTVNSESKAKLNAVAAKSESLTPEQKAANVRENRKRALNSEKANGEKANAVEAFNKKEAMASNVKQAKMFRNIMNVAQPAKLPKLIEEETKRIEGAINVLDSKLKDVNTPESDKKGIKSVIIDLNKRAEGLKKKLTIMETKRLNSKDESQSIYDEINKIVKMKDPNKAQKMLDKLVEKMAKDEKVNGEKIGYGNKSMMAKVKKAISIAYQFTSDKQAKIQGVEEVRVNKLRAAKFETELTTTDASKKEAKINKEIEYLNKKLEEYEKRVANPENTEEQEKQAKARVFETKLNIERYTNRDFKTGIRLTDEQLRATGENIPKKHASLNRQIAKAGIDIRPSIINSAISSFEKDLSNRKSALSEATTESEKKRIQKDIVAIESIIEKFANAKIYADNKKETKAEKANSYKMLDSLKNEIVKSPNEEKPAIYDRAIGNLNQQIESYKNKIKNSKSGDDNQEFINRINDLEKRVLDLQKKKTIAVNSNEKIALTVKSREEKLQNKEEKTTIKEAVKQYENEGKDITNNFKKTVLNAASQAFVYGFANSIKNAIDIMAQFETQVVESSKVMDRLYNSYGQIANAARDFGVKYGVSITDAAKAMTVFAQQGKNVSETITLTEASLVAVNTTTLNAAEATEALTAALLQFNISDKDAMRVIDSWLEVESKTAVTSNTMANALKITGTAARIAGISFNELNGMISAVGSATRESGQALGTAFKFIISKMRTTESVDAIEKLGIAVYNQDGTFRDAIQIMGDLNERWQGMTSEQRANTAITIAGTRRYNTLMVLMEKWSDVLDATKMSEDSHGKAMAMNALVMDTYAKKAEQAKASIQGLYTVLAEGGTKQFVSGIQKSVTAVSQLVAGVPEIGKALGTLALPMAVTYGFAKVNNIASTLGLHDFVRKKDANLKESNLIESSTVGLRKKMGFSPMASPEVATAYVSKLDNVEKAKEKLAARMTRIIGDRENATAKERLAIHQRMVDKIQEKIERERVYGELVSKNNKVQNMAIAASGILERQAFKLMAAGMLATGASSMDMFKDDSSLSGKTKAGEVLSIAGGATSSTGLGAMMGKFFGPRGALIGGVAGLATSLLGLSSEIESLFEGSSQRKANLAYEKEDGRMKTLESSLLKYADYRKREKSGEVLTPSDIAVKEEAKNLIMRAEPGLSEMKEGELFPTLKEKEVESLINNIGGLNNNRLKISDKFAVNAMFSDAGGGKAAPEMLRNEISVLKRQYQSKIDDIKEFDESKKGRELSPSDYAKRSKLTESANSVVDKINKTKELIDKIESGFYAAMSQRGTSLSDIARKGDASGQTVSASKDLIRVFNEIVKNSGGNVGVARKKSFEKILSGQFSGRTVMGQEDAAEEASKTGYMYSAVRLAKQKDGTIKYLLRKQNVEDGSYSDDIYNLEAGMDAKKAIKEISERKGINSKAIVTSTEISDILFQYSIAEIEKFVAVSEKVTENIYKAFQLANSRVERLIGASSKFSIVGIDKEFNGYGKRMTEYSQWSKEKIKALGTEDNDTKDKIIALSDSKNPYAAMTAGANLIANVSYGKNSNTLMGSMTSSLSSMQAENLRTKGTDALIAALKPRSWAGSSAEKARAEGADDNEMESIGIREQKKIQQILEQAGFGHITVDQIISVAGSEGKSDNETMKEISNLLKAANAINSQKANEKVEGVVKNASDYLDEIGSKVKDIYETAENRREKEYLGKIGETGKTGEEAKAIKKDSYKSVEVYLSSIAKEMESVGNIDSSLKAFVEIQEKAVADAVKNRDSLKSDATEAQKASAKDSVLAAEKKLEEIKKSILPILEKSKEVQRRFKESSTFAGEEYSAQASFLKKLDRQIKEKIVSKGSFNYGTNSALFDEMQVAREKAISLSEKKTPYIEEMKALEGKSNLNEKEASRLDALRILIGPINLALEENGKKIEETNILLEEANNQRTKQIKSDQNDFFANKMIGGQGTARSQKAVYDGIYGASFSAWQKVSSMMTDKSVSGKGWKDEANSLAQSMRKITDMKEAADRIGDVGYQKNYLLASSQEKSAVSQIEGMKASGMTLEQIFSDTGLQEMAKNSPLVQQALERMLQREENTRLEDISNQTLLEQKIQTDLLTKIAEKTGDKNLLTVAEQLKQLVASLTAQKEAQDAVFKASPALKIPGASSGGVVGFTGSGGKYQSAGLVEVHKGEALGVLNATAVARNPQLSREVLSTISQMNSGEISGFSSGTNFSGSTGNINISPVNQDILKSIEGKVDRIKEGVNEANKTSKKGYYTLEKGSNLYRNGRESELTGIEKAVNLFYSTNKNDLVGNAKFNKSHGKDRIAISGQTSRDLTLKEMDLTDKIKDIVSQVKEDGRKYSRSEAIELATKQASSEILESIKNGEQIDGARFKVGESGVLRRRGKYENLIVDAADKISNTKRMTIQQFPGLANSRHTRDFLQTFPSETTNLAQSQIQPENKNRIKIATPGTPIGGNRIIPVEPTIEIPITNKEATRNKIEYKEHGNRGFNLNSGMFAISSGIEGIKNLRKAYTGESGIIGKDGKGIKLSKEEKINLYTKGSSEGMVAGQMGINALAQDGNKWYQKNGKISSSLGIFGAITEGGRAVSNFANGNTSEGIQASINAGLLTSFSPQVRTRVANLVNRIPGMSPVVNNGFMNGLNKSSGFGMAGMAAGRLGQMYFDSQNPDEKTLGIKNSNLSNVSSIVGDIGNIVSYYNPAIAATMATSSSLSEYGKMGMFGFGGDKLYQENRAKADSTQNNNSNWFKTALEGGLRILTPASMAKVDDRRLADYYQREQESKEKSEEKGYEKTFVRQGNKNSNKLTKNATSEQKLKTVGSLIGDLITNEKYFGIKNQEGALQEVFESSEIKGDDANSLMNNKELGWEERLKNNQEIIQLQKENNKEISQVAKDINNTRIMTLTEKNNKNMKKYSNIGIKDIKEYIKKTTGTDYTEEETSSKVKEISQKIKEQKVNIAKESLNTAISNKKDSSSKLYQKAKNTNQSQFDISEEEFNSKFGEVDFTQELNKIDSSLVSENEKNIKTLKEKESNYNNVSNSSLINENEIRPNEARIIVANIAYEKTLREQKEKDDSNKKLVEEKNKAAEVFENDQNNTSIVSDTKTNTKESMGINLPENRTYAGKSNSKVDEKKYALKEIKNSSIKMDKGWGKSGKSSLGNKVDLNFKPSKTEYKAPASSNKANNKKYDYDTKTDEEKRLDSEYKIIQSETNKTIEERKKKIADEAVPGIPEAAVMDSKINENMIPTVEQVLADNGEIKEMANSMQATGMSVETIVDLIKTLISAVQTSSGQAQVKTTGGVSYGDKVTSSQIGD